MTGRVLLIPAAGLGSRLGAGMPKLLVPVAGVPMVDRLRDLYQPFVSRIVLVVHPSFAAAVEDHVAGWEAPVSIAVQDRPTGMLDAILLGTPAVHTASPEHVWITWCDQVGVHPETVNRLAKTASAHPGAAVALPTVWRTSPYIHFDRDNAGTIVNVRHRREGDAMPEEGESDMGLFSLSASAFLDLLPAFASDVDRSAGTGERNFLPFIPWVAARHEVVTFSPVDEAEAVGVNTPEELAAVERYLAARAAGART
jgi:CTP:molybdopterin cytidylyltransferase MocA